MADRFYGYQYDTSPRKLNVEYAPYKKRYPKSNEPAEESNSRNKQKKNVKKNNDSVIKDSNYKNNTIRSRYEKSQVLNKKQKINKEPENEGINVIKNNKVSKVSVKTKMKIILFLVAGFSVLFTISYQNSLINESFNRKERYKKEMEALNKTNQQIEVGIENNLNLNNIEQAAKEKIGMQKLSNDQKIYVSLPKVDYVAPASEQVVVKEDTNLLEKIIKLFWK